MFLEQVHSLPASREARRRSREDPIKLGLWTMWNLAYADARKVYGNDDPQCVAGQPVIDAVCKQSCVEPSPLLRIVPINPNEPMLEGNIAVVDKAGRTLLANIWKNGGSEQVYGSALAFLQQQQRSDPSGSVQAPEQPQDDAASVPAT